MGVEPTSTSQKHSSLRPFPSSRLAVAATPGRVAPERSRRRVFPRGQRSFPTVSGALPAVHHRFCCRAAMIRPRVPLLVAVALCRQSGGESERASVVSLVAPFRESGRLWSRAWASTLVSKPVGPMFDRQSYCIRRGISTPDVIRSRYLCAPIRTGCPAAHTSVPGRTGFLHREPPPSG